MASKFGELKASGSSQGNFNCEWTIKRFSSLHRTVGKRYQSEIFQLEEKGTEWFLSLYPGGQNEDSKGYVSCFIHKNGGSKQNVKLKFALSLRNADDDVFFERVLDEWYVLETLGYGYCKTIKAGDLIPKLVGDSLIITVEATYCISYIKYSAGIYRYAEVTPMVKLIDDLKKMLCNKENSDFVISVAGEDVPVHAAVLSARSKVLSNMFKHDTLENDSGRVVITDFERDAIDSFVEFIYSGAVRKLDFDLALELLRASDKYEVSDLRSHCSNYLVSLLDDDNVCRLLVDADAYNATELRKHALEYFCKNMSMAFFESQRSLFEGRSNLLFDIIKGFLS